MVSHRLDYESKYRHVRSERILVQDYEPKAGDILLMNSTCGRPIVNFALNGFYHHFAIVIKQDGEYYSLETADSHILYPDSPGGLKLSPMKDLLKSVLKHIHIIPINKELDDDRNSKLLDLAFRRRNDMYPNNFTLAFRYFFDQTTRDDIVSPHCLDLIAIAMKDIGFINMMTLPFAKKSYAIENLHKMLLPNDYEYFHPIELVNLGGIF